MLLSPVFSTVQVTVITSPENIVAGGAGEIETSLMLAAAKELVVEDRFTSGFVGEMTGTEIRLVFEKGMKALTKIGVLGDPTKATADRGEVYAKRIVDFLVEKISKQM